MTTSRDSTFQHPANTGQFDAYWNPSIRLKLSTGGRQSPAIALGHELGHAKQCVEKLAWYEANSNGTDYLKIEEDNVQSHETPIARDLHEPVRANYQEFKGTEPFVGKKYQGKSPLDLVTTYL